MNGIKIYTPRVEVDRPLHLVVSRWWPGGFVNLSLSALFRFCFVVFSRFFGFVAPFFVLFCVSDSGNDSGRLFLPRAPLGG